MHWSKLYSFPTSAHCIRESIAALCRVYLAALLHCPHRRCMMLLALAGAAGSERPGHGLATRCCKRAEPCTVWLHC